MRIFLSALFLACLISPALVYGQKEDWAPITQQDLEFKAVPGDPGAPAVRLYYVNNIDDTAETEFIYERIKVLNDKGKKYGDVEIGSIPGMTITDLKARTIRPDGSIVDFTGKPFEKTIFKSKGVKVSAKTFTLPEVSAGSIVEYKCKLNFRNTALHSTDIWVLQSEIYTVKESFFFKPAEESEADFFGLGGTRVSWVTANLKQAPKNTATGVTLEVQNIAAFEAEDYMPPENNYKPTVRFFYPHREFSSAEKGWQELGKDWNEAVEKYLSSNKGVKEAASTAIADETEPGLKLRKLYLRAQQIRNLSFERERSSEELKKENIKNNQGVGDVLKRGYGTDDEITLLFIAMARAAGFEASAVTVGDRADSFFNKEWVSTRQLDTMVADVKLNDKEMYLEPGTKFCPYGMLRWRHSATTGLKLDKKGGSLIQIPGDSYEKAITHRTADLTLTEDGTLKGEITVEFKGHEAFEHRLDALQKDDLARKTELEDELKQSLPLAAVVKAKDVQGWDDPDDALTARFTIEVPGYASVAGKRLLIPAYLFQTRQNDVFKHAERKYPVYFPYSFGEYDTINIRVPAGAAVESVPEEQQARLGYALYQNVTQFDGQQLNTQRRLFFNGMFIDLNKYSEVKDFFSKVQTGDERQAVLRAGGVSAQKGN